MARVSAKRVVTDTNHHGIATVPLTAEQQLRRLVMTCLLWENEYYKDGHTTVGQIQDLVQRVEPDVVASIAREARSKHHLRHVPLWLVVSLLKAGAPVRDLIADVVQRPDEMQELIALYWLSGRRPLDNQLRRGLAKAFVKFNEYQLAKFDKPGPISIRDIMFMCHPKPTTEAQAELFKRITNKSMATPDTWETELSAGKNKVEVFTRLINERKLGADALLKNLRGMAQAGVEDTTIRSALAVANTDRLLPFQFITAAKYAPRFEAELEQLMFKCLEGSEKLKGHTALLVDVSPSMTDNKLSEKSELNRLDGACGLAMLIREICESCQVFTFAETCKEIKPRRGFALRDQIYANLEGATKLGAAIRHVNDNSKYDRLVAITDEESQDAVGGPTNPNAYMINVSTNEKSVGFGPYKRIAGWSTQVVKFIQELESTND